MGVELVVIGTSWGGLRALECLLGGLPASFGVPVAVTQHRQPGGQELLVDLLANHTPMRVVEAEDKQPLAAGTAHIAPSGYHLLVERGHCTLSTDAEVHYSRPSIDVLFESAAKEYGEGLVSVLLTGANDDGACGTEQVVEHGGHTIVQNPETAVRSEMPRAALERCAVDDVLELEDVAARLLELVG